MQAIALTVARIENTMAKPLDAAVITLLTYRIGGITEAVIDCIEVGSALTIVYARLRALGEMQMKRM